MEATTQKACCVKVETIVMMLGSNDLLQHLGLSAEVCSDRIELFLRLLILKETLSSHQILLVALLPMKPGAWVDNFGTLEESCRLAGCYRPLAQKLGVSFAGAGE